MEINEVKIPLSIRKAEQAGRFVVRRFKVSIGEKSYEVSIEEIIEGPTLARESQPTPKSHTPPKQTKDEKPDASKEEIIFCPMPAKVLCIKCKVGEKVRSGDVLLVIEAMKMEHNIFSPREGVILDIKTAAGASVSYNQPLIVIQ